MNITTERVSPEVAVLTLDGELDGSNYRKVIDAGAGLYADGARRLVLDLSALSYMSSSGIVAIHSLVVVFRGGTPPDPDEGWEAIHAVGRDVADGVTVDVVRLVAPQPAVERVLERTGLTRLVPVHTDRGAAVA